MPPSSLAINGVFNIHLNARFHTYYIFRIAIIGGGVVV